MKIQSHPQYKINELDYTNDELNKIAKSAGITSDQVLVVLDMQIEVDREKRLMVKTTFEHKVDELLILVKQCDTHIDIYELIDNATPNEDYIYAGLWAFVQMTNNRTHYISDTKQALRILDHLVDEHPIFSESRGLDYVDKDKAINICLDQLNKQVLKALMV